MRGHHDELHGRHGAHHERMRGHDGPHVRRSRAGQRPSFHAHGRTLRLEPCRRCDGSEDARPRNGEEGLLQRILVGRHGDLGYDNAAHPAGNIDDTLRLHRQRLDRRPLHLRHRRRPPALRLDDDSRPHNIQAARLRPDTHDARHLPRVRSGLQARDTSAASADHHHRRSRRPKPEQWRSSTRSCSASSTAKCAGRI